jgi:hypothetical protein
MRCSHDGMRSHGVCVSSSLTCALQVTANMRKSARRQRRQVRRDHGRLRDADGKPLTRQSHADALSGAIDKVMAENRLDKTIFHSDWLAMLRAEYVTQDGYNAAPEDLSLDDTVAAATKWPHQGDLYWVDPGGVFGSRPHRGYELVLQPYMQALEKSDRCHVHLRTVVFDIQRQQSGTNAPNDPQRIKIQFRTAATQLSYDEDSIMRTAHGHGAGDPAAAAPSRRGVGFGPVVSAAATHDARVREADYLVCTVPVAVLAEQEPPVIAKEELAREPAHAAAIRRLAAVAGKELRCFLAFRHPLVREAGEYDSSLSATAPALVRTAWHTTVGKAGVEPWRFYVYPNTSALDPLTAPPVAQVLVAVMDPARISTPHREGEDPPSHWSQDRLAQDALEHLGILFTQQAVNDAGFLGALASHWLRDPFSRCAYVLIHPGTSAHDVKKLAQPMSAERIYFAGEGAMATLRELQQVSGAQLAGEEAARKIMCVSRALPAAAPHAAPHAARACSVSGSLVLLADLLRRASVWLLCCVCPATKPERMGGASRPCRR